MTNKPKIFHTYKREERKKIFNLETLKSHNSLDKAKLKIIGSAMKSSRFPLL